MKQVLVVVSGLFFCVALFLGGCNHVLEPVEQGSNDFINIYMYAYDSLGNEPDSSATPYANQIAVDGDYVYVGLQRRNGFKPGGNTIILKIDPTSDEVVDTFHMAKKNNYDLIAVDGNLYASNPGSNYAVGDGAIEQINLADGTLKTVIDEVNLGGNPNGIVHKSGSVFYVQVYIAWGSELVFEIDFSDGSIIDTIPDVVDAFGGIYYDKTSKRLFVGERDVTDAGVKIFENNILVGSTISSGNSLPPTSFCVVGDNIFFSESDFKTGFLEMMKISDNKISTTNMEIASDAVVRSDGNNLYVLERFGSDKILCIDPSNIGVSGIIYESVLSAESNPSDIEFISASKAYVTLQNEAKILIIDPLTGD